MIRETTARSPIWGRAPWQRLLSALLFLAAMSWSCLGLASQDAQSASAPTFEVASVRQNKSGEVAQESHVTNGRLTVRNMSLRNIIKNAYGFREDARLRGGPSWIDGIRYDINATAGGQADKAQVLLMLRSLLSERFRLASHHETAELPAYLLLPAKNGPKVPELRGYKPRNPSPDVQILTCLGPPSGLVTMLSGMLERPVLDRTGLTGRYDFTMEIRRDAPPALAPAGEPDRANASLAGLVFGALQEQLGLKLEATKAPLDVLVIDRIEKPSEN